MKKNLILMLTFFALSNVKGQVPAGVSDSTFFYRPDGTKEWFAYQRDVAVFRYNGGSAYTGTLPPLVKSIQWLGNEPHGYNVITWDSLAPNAQIDIQNAYLSGDPLFEYGFIPCTRLADKWECAGKKKWFMGSDLINVRFKDAVVSPAMLSAFQSNNMVTLYHRPDASLPNADSWTWVFRLLEVDRFTPYDKCAKIWLNNQSLVSHVEPDMAILKQSDCLLPSEFGAWNSTVHPDALWHIQNNGNNVYQTLGAGVAGADANLCECWGDGYTGKGIKVAVIDGGGYDYTHPDMTGQYLNGYDFINMTPFSTTYYVNNNDPHGMKVASAIAAKANGGMVAGQSINATAVGAAYDCKILPYIIDVTLTQLAFNTQVGMAIQKAVVDGADVVNMSFEGSYSSQFWAASTMKQEILQAVTMGRSGKGVVFVSSTGNNNTSGLFYPAAMDEVIGVGATDPNDYRGSYLQSNPWTWQNIPNAKGSNYLTMAGAGTTTHYDVMAPGTDIRVAYTANPQTTPNQTSSSGTGTSFSSPLVAGIAAIILQKYPSLSYQQVTTMIDLTADKVRSGTGGTTPYDYSAYSNVPGYARETFYGRVNCSEALKNPSVGIKEIGKKSADISLFYISTDEATLLLNGTNTAGYTLNIYDVSGRQIDSQNIEAGKNTYPINTDSFVKGVYLFNVVSTENENGKAFKYIK